MRTILLLFALLALAVPVRAHDCAGWTTSTTNDEMIVLEVPDHVLGVRYVVSDLCQDDERDAGDPNDPYDDRGPCLFAIWLYYETNGIDGLQRGDELRDDTCHWMIESDTFVW